MASSEAVTEPAHLSTGFSAPASTTHNVGQFFIGNLRTNASLFDFSVSIEAHTNLGASGASTASLNTNAFMLRHVWHQGAHASMNKRRCSFRARARAPS